MPLQKTKCSVAAAAVLNLFLVANLKMPSLEYSLPFKYQSLCIYLSTQLSYRNVIRLKMLAIPMLNFQKSD